MGGCRRKTSPVPTPLTVEAQHFYAVTCQKQRTSRTCKYQSNAWRRVFQTHTVVNTNAAEGAFIPAYGPAYGPVPAPAAGWERHRRSGRAGMPRLPLRPDIPGAQCHAIVLQSCPAPLTYADARVNRKRADQRLTTPCCAVGGWTCPVAINAWTAILIQPLPKRDGDRYPATSTRTCKVRWKASKGLGQTPSGTAEMAAS